MAKKQEKEKVPFLCKVLDHNYIRVKELDKAPNKQACRCSRCGKVIYLIG